MANLVQIKRRLSTAAQASPAGTGAEGELAAFIPGIMGGSAPASLYVSDGGAWRTIIDGSDQSSVPSFSSTIPYKTGDVVLQGGQMYQATGAVAAGAFNAANWLQITNTGGVANFSATSPYKLGDVVIQAGSIYQSLGPLTAGPFAPANWTQISNAGGVANHSTTVAYKLGDVVISGGEIYQASAPIAAGAFSAGAWSKITNTAGVSVVGYAAGPGATVEAAFNADRHTIGAGQITIYTYKGAAYIYTGPMGAPVTSALASQFTSLGSATTFATNLEAAAGTLTSVAINPANLTAWLAAQGVNTSTGAADAGKVPLLDAAGKLSSTMLNITGVDFKGATDLTAAIPAGPHAKGDIYFAVAPVASPTGTVDPSWTGAAGKISAGDMAIYDGAKWSVISADVSLARYVPLAGAAMAAGDATKLSFTPATDKTVVLDGGTPTAMGSADHFVIDGGVY